MPKWNADSNIQKNPVFGIAIGFVALLIIIYNALHFQMNAITIINLLSATALLFYGASKAYGELTKDQDFIEITANGIIHRSTNGYSLIPRVTTISFSQIEKVDLVQISSLLRPEKKTTAILLQPKTGKNQFIGTNLTEEQQTAVLLALKGSVGFSHALQKLLGPDANVDETIKNVVSNAKDLWNKLKQQ